MQWNNHTNITTSRFFKEKAIGWMLQHRTLLTLLCVNIIQHMLIFIKSSFTIHTLSLSGWGREIRMLEADEFKLKQKSFHFLNPTYACTHSMKLCETHCFFQQAPLFLHKQALSHTSASTCTMKYLFSLTNNFKSLLFDTFST